MILYNYIRITFKTNSQITQYVRGPFTDVFNLDLLIAKVLPL